jgi:hypothetical protein
MFVLLFEVTNKNLLLDFMPESLGMFLFGVGLIAFAVSLRRIFNQKEMAEENFERLAEKISR